MAKKIVIIGFMAAGKSVAAERLASGKGWQCVSLDRLIEAESCRTIAQIFAEEGESGFRQRESRLLQQVLAEDGGCCLIDGGGGVILLERNREILRQACVIFLDTGFAEILSRLKSAGVVRPVLAGLDDEAVRQLWEARRQIYIKTADFVVKDMAELSELFDRITQRGQ